MGEIYALNSQNMNDWVVHCKALLIKMECANIETRSNHWSSIVNTQTHHTNHRLNINQSFEQYKYDCNAIEPKYLDSFKTVQNGKYRCHIFLNCDGIIALQ